jgi:hypothetical protein
MVSVGGAPQQPATPGARSGRRGALLARPNTGGRLSDVALAIGLPTGHIGGKQACVPAPPPGDRWPTCRQPGTWAAARPQPTR